jgi:hypothetical protein
MATILEPTTNFSDFVAIAQSIGALQAVYYFIADGVIFTETVLQAITKSGKYAVNFAAVNPAITAAVVLAAFPSAISLDSPPGALE